MLYNLKSMPPSVDSHLAALNAAAERGELKLDQLRAYPALILHFREAILVPATREEAYRRREQLENLNPVEWDELMRLVKSGGYVLPDDIDRVKKRGMITSWDRFGTISLHSALMSESSFKRNT